MAFVLNATKLKNGTTFLSGGFPYKVIKYTLVKIGRGGAIVRVNAKNLSTGSIEDKTFSSNIKVEAVTTHKKALRYLYHDAIKATFMDMASYEQIEIPLKIIGEDLKYIKDGDQVDVLFWSDQALSCELPPNVTLKVSETPPGVKGNSASNVYKEARLENGLKVKVPLFVKSGDLVRVDTRSGDYLERVKED